MKSKHFKLFKNIYLNKELKSTILTHIIKSSLACTALALCNIIAPMVAHAHNAIEIENIRNHLKNTVIKTQADTNTNSLKETILAKTKTIAQTIAENRQNYRPELSGYAANMAVSSKIFNMRLRQRNASHTIIGYEARGKEYKKTSTWLHLQATKNQNQDDNDQLFTKASSKIFMLGNDLLVGSRNGQDLWILGIMGGYGSYDSNSRSKITEYKSKSSFDGYSYGMYGTWYSKNNTNEGLYLDGWFNYNKFNNNVKSEDFHVKNYKSQGYSASIESGYTFLIGSFTSLKSMTNKFLITPQLQAIWTNIKAEDFYGKDNSKFSYLGDENIETRFGVRFELNSYDRELTTNIKPYLELNWLHNSKDYGIQMLNDNFYINGTKALHEVEFGIEAQYKNHLSVWTSIAAQKGDNDYNATKGTFGLKVQF